MALSATDTVERLLENWLRFVQRHVWLFLFLILAFTVFGVFYIKDNLGINTDTTDMLSEELAWRKNYLNFKNAFPQFSDNIAIVIESDTPDQTQDATIALTERLKKESQLFPSVFQLENSAFFRQNSLLYLDTTELEDLADNLAAVQPFVAKLQQNQNIRGLFSVLTQALEEQDEDVDLKRILAAMDKTISGYLQNHRQRMSWHELMSRRNTTTDDKRAVITVQPKLNYSKLLPGEPAIETLRKIVSEMKLQENYGAQIRLTGDVALSYDELDSVTRGAKTGGLIALFVVTVILVIGLRSLSLVFATLITLITGLIWTASFATFAVGELNMISVAFMVLYIGLGVDFAIHICLRYREQRSDIDQDLNQYRAVSESGKHIGASLLLCAFTTAIGFYAFLPTAYSGVAELGLISGTGMFISLFLSLSLLPALLSVLPYNPAKNKLQSGSRFAWIQIFPATHARSIIITSIILGIISLITLPRISFDHNPIHLMDPNAESVQTYQDLLAESSRSPLSINLIETDIGDLPDQLAELGSVSDVITINNFIPSDQDEKLAIIEDLALVMDMHETPEQQPVTDQDRIKAITEFAEQLKIEQPDQAINKTLEKLLELKKPDLQSLEQDLIASLPGRLRSLEESLEAEEVSKESLPVDLLDRWQSRYQLYRIEIFPEQDMDDNLALEKFVNDVRIVAPDATGTPVINLEASKAVIQAFKQAFALAIIIITLLLWFLLDKKSDTFLVLIPLILAGLLTCAASVIFDIPFNFANIIALPLLLGVGVDSSVHILHRYRTALPESGLLLNTSTARAVLFSALTTACSFGNLAISPHQGTASMGVLLSIGLVLMVIITLIVLPALLILMDKKS